MPALAALKIDEWNRMIDVNIKGVLHGIAAVLPIMQAQDSGQVINVLTRPLNSAQFDGAPPSEHRPHYLVAGSVSSIGGLNVSPTAVVYCATKFAVRAISDGLRQESEKIRVTVVCPGVVESELAESISDESARTAMKAFRSVAIAPEAIARAIAYAMSSQRMSTSASSL